MLKRIKFFGFGFLLSILILSFTGGNRLSDTFLAYINYFNMNKRVIYHLDKKEMLIFSEKSKCQMDLNKIEKKDISMILKNSKINFSKSKRSNDTCQFFVVEGLFLEDKIVMNFTFCADENTSTLNNIILNNNLVNCE